MCYINTPDNKSIVGFVFICPGRFEEKHGKPCVGQTGTNLESCLHYLVKKRSDIFQSVNRYDYLITNAWPRVEYKSKTGRSTPSRIEILTKNNIERLYCEIKHLDYVIACGEHAHIAVKICKEFLGFKGIVVNMKHTSSQALGCPTTDERESRLEEWADEVINKLQASGNFVKNEITTKST